MKLQMIIRDRIEASGRSLRSVAAAAGVNAGNLSRFLSTGRGVSVAKIDRLLDVLDIHFAAMRYPASLAWLDSADHWYALVRKRLPAMDPAELRQIVVSILRPVPKRRFLLRRFGDGLAL